MAMTLRLTAAEDQALTDLAKRLGVSKHEAVRQSILQLTKTSVPPATTDWLAAAEYVGKRDRELLDRLAQ